MLQILLRAIVCLSYIISICHGFTSINGLTRLRKVPASAAIDAVMYPRQQFNAKSKSLGRKNFQWIPNHKQAKSVTSALASEASDAIVQFVVEHPLQDFIALFFFKFAYDAGRDGASLPVAFVAGFTYWIHIFHMQSSI